MVHSVRRSAFRISLTREYIGAIAPNLTGDSGRVFLERSRSEATLRHPRPHPPPIRRTLTRPPPCISQDSLRRVSSSKDPFDAAGTVALAKRGRSRNVRATRRAETARELVRARPGAIQERPGRGKRKAGDRVPWA